MSDQYLTLYLIFGSSFYYADDFIKSIYLTIFFENICFRYWPSDVHTT